MPPPRRSPGVRAGEGPGVGALPPAGRHVPLPVPQQRGAWGRRGGTRDAPLPPSCPGDGGIREDIVAGGAASPPNTNSTKSRRVGLGYFIFISFYFNRPVLAIRQTWRELPPPPPRPPRSSPAKL